MSRPRYSSTGLLPWFMLLGLSGLSCLAAVELVLKDGRVLKGVDVRRADDLYELQTDGGEVIPIPGQLVEEVRLIEEREPPSLPPGFVNEGPQQLAGEPPPPGATGLRASEAQTLEGPTITPPRPSEQLAVLGSPAKFQRGVIDPDWHPSTDWDMSLSNNNFAPAQWSKSIIDSDWQPTSDYTDDTDVSDFNPATFTESVIDSSWTPQDGFKKKDLSSLPRSSIDGTLAVLVAKHPHTDRSASRCS